MAATVNIAGNFFSAFASFFLLILPIILVVALFAYKKRLKLFPIAAIVIERRDNNLVIKTDRIGRVNEAGIWKYKFRKSKETIPNPDYNQIVNGTYTPSNLFEKIAFMLDAPIGFAFFYKYGSQQYKPVRIRLKDAEGNQTEQFKTVFKPTRDEYGNKVYVKQTVQISPFSKMVIPEFDIIDWDNMNFIVQEHENTDNRRKKKEDFMKKILIPAMIIGVAAVIFIVAMYFASQLVQFGASQISGVAPVAGGNVTGAGVPILGGMMPD